MNKRKTNSTAKKIEVEYTDKDIREMQKAGAAEDEMPVAGTHKFGRSRFVTARKAQKIRISILIDADILDFFKERADQPDAAAYQTQINNELRAVMEAENEPEFRILENPRFISALSEKLKQVA